VPPGVLLLRSPSAVTGAFGREDADGEPLVLEIQRDANYRVYPPEEGSEPEGGILSLVHEDAIASFVVGTIDDLRVATLEGLFGLTTDSEQRRFALPEPRVEEVFERRVVLRRDGVYPASGGRVSEDALAFPPPWSQDVLSPRTFIGGAGCLRPPEFPERLVPAFEPDASSPRLGELSEDFLGCFPNDDTFDEPTGDDFNPRQVRNRFQLDPLEQEDDCDIAADPVTVNTIYRVTHRGALLRGGSDVEVEVLDASTLQLDFPGDLEDFDLRPGDAVDLHLRCRVPEPETFAEFQDDRLELTYVGARLERVGPGPRALVVSVAGVEPRRFFAPDGTIPEGFPESGADSAQILVDCTSSSGAGTLRPLDLAMFDFEIYPAEGEDVAVLTRETEDGLILGDLARCPVSNEGGEVVARFDGSCQEDLPLRFTWRAASSFECRRSEGNVATTPTERRQAAQLLESDAAEEEATRFDPLELGRPCTSSAQCGRGRQCVGFSTSCPGQCEPWCTSNECFAQWSMRVCDSLEIRVNGARPVEADLAGSTDGTPGAAVPGDSLFVPESPAFLHSFPGARNIRQLRLPRSTTLRSTPIID